MSGAYLWNRYSQRLQIECAAWSCGLILHYCLPSNSLRYFYFFFCHDFVRAISLEPLLAETPNSLCCLVLRSNFALLLTIQFASLFIYFFYFFFRHDFVRRIVFHLRGIAPRSHTGRPRTCLVLIYYHFSYVLYYIFVLVCLLPHFTVDFAGYQFLWGLQT